MVVGCGSNGPGYGYNGSVMYGAEEERIYTISEVNRLADGLLQGLVIWVEGEISNLRAYPNFTFFSLSDEDAVLPCVIFGDATAEMRFELQEGMTLLARGRLGIYIKKGQYRLNVYEAQEAGEGRLKREFLRLMRKLSKEGLFDEGIKRPLPPYPDLVGLVTSLEGAAVRDVVTNLTARFPGSHLVIRGVRVQGEEAVGEIVGALELFNRAFPVDVLIVARGGGSLEDLHPFNTEEVARAIRASSIPVVTGVGHEPDITLSDLAADFRASTPTGAALAAVPAASEVASLTREMEKTLLGEVRRHVHARERRLASLEKRRPFADPSLMLNQARQRLAEGEAGIETAARSMLVRGSGKVESFSRSISRYPREYRQLPAAVEAAAGKLSSALRSWMKWRREEPERWRRELAASTAVLLSGAGNRVRLAASSLEALSPLAVLSRGYAIVTKGGERKPLKDSLEVEEGETVDVRLHRGGLNCEVKGVSAPRADDTV